MFSNLSLFYFNTKFFIANDTNYQQQHELDNEFQNFFVFGM